MITIKFDGLEHVDNFVKKVAPEVIEVAQRNAINKTLAKVKTRTAKSVALASGASKKIVKKRLRQYRASYRDKNGAVVFRMTQVPVEIMAGKSGVQWNRRMGGAKAGRKSFAGSFGATPTKGKRAGIRKRVYERVSNTGDDRKDLHGVFIQMKPHGPILNKVGQRVVASDLVKTFHSQMKHLLKKRGYTR